MPEPMKLDLLKRLQDWEEIHGAIVDLLSYWQSQPKALPQIHAVVSIKHVMRLIEDDLLKE